MRTSKGEVMLVEDDIAARSALERLLTNRGFSVHTAFDGQDALEHLSELVPDVIVTDLNMPRLDGRALLERLRREHASLPVVIVTASDDVSSAVEAMRAGAADYLTKPLNVDELTATLERAVQQRTEQVESPSPQRRPQDTDEFGGLLGTSPAMQQVYRVARQVAPSRATILLTGESGTGKGELARTLHRLSPRGNEPFVSVHCAALAESLLESELFGHERGAFTGADKRRPGRFEQAHRGTLFLDEIGEINSAVQVKLLQVLQERTLRRVGGTELLTVDVRVIAATNRNLAKEVREGRFREDLYFRLDVVHVEMPPLRARGNDVLLLAEHFLRRFAADNHRTISGFSEDARSKLLAQRWNGNVRALENAIERAVVLSEEDVIRGEDLTGDDPESGTISIPGSTMEEIERYAITRTLAAVGGSTTKAAQMLNRSVRLIQYRMHEYGLTAERDRWRGKGHP